MTPDKSAKAPKAVKPPKAAKARRNRNGVSASGWEKIQGYARRNDWPWWVRRGPRWQTVADDCGGDE
jgi:hypothetical protein